MNPHRDSSKKIGQLLVARGLASGDQVLRAILSQRSHGGRLGTCLLELDVVREEQLLEILAEQQGSPAASPDRLRSIPADVIALVSPEMARRCLAVPFAATERLLDVATPNTRNVALLDEIAFSTGRRVRAHVVNEVRLHEALARYYGVRCSSRYRQLLDRLNSSRRLWAEKQSRVPVPAAAGARRGAPDLGGLGYLADADVDVAWSAPEDALALPATGGAGAGSAGAGRAGPEKAPPANGARSANGGAALLDRPQEPLDLADVDQLLGEADDVAGIGQVLASYLGQRFARCALFRVRQDALEPWLCRGEGFDSQLFGAAQITLREPSVFLNLARGAEFHLGALPPMPAHQKLVGCWGGAWPKECLVLPVRLRDRMVVALYGDGGAESMAGIRIDDWKTLTAMTADALELCILRKKLQDG